MTNKNKAVTYSILSHIRNNGELIKGPLDVFIPLIKRVIASLNRKEIYSGKSIGEIKAEADELYSLDFPIPVLKTILNRIAIEVNTEDATRFFLYADGSFAISKYTFDEFEEVFNEKKKEIDNIESLYITFKESTESTNDSENIFKFIERNKHSLCKFFSIKGETNGEDYTLEAQFINFFKSIPSVYEVIEDIYLGSIIACYVEYQPHINTGEVELILDTNFIVGLLDLNTPESTHTCRTLVQVAISSGYKITVLKATIDETENLLKNKAHNFDKSFLQKKINPEDVYNACDRRNLNKSDLERIADNIQIELNKFKIFILANHDKLTNEARYTSEFEDLKKIRNSEISALHDATAILYVKKKRGKNVQDFEKVNSWFVNNSTSYSGEIYSVRNGIQPISIKADDLLNILWLSSPSINSNFSANDLVNIGLTSTISLTLNKNLPKSKVLKDLDDNLCKYAQEEIADEDILRVARRITNKQLIDIEELNSIAESDKEEFIKRLNDEASKQKALEEKTARSIDSVFKAIRSEANKLSQAKREYEELTNDNQSQILGLKEALMISEKKIREIREEEFISSEIKKWRRKSIFECVIFLSILIFIMFIVLKENNYNLDEAYKYYTSHIILSIIVSTLILILNGFALKSLYDKYRNHSNIENYKKNIKIPVVL